MIVRSISLVLITLLVHMTSGQVFAKKLPDTIIFAPEAMAEAKEKFQTRDRALRPAFKKLIDEADHALKAPAESVIFKPTPPPSGDMHDYWSIAPYLWPTQEMSSDSPYVRHDGERNPEADSETYDRSRMRRMSSDALTLALAWFLTEDEEYAGKATALIWSWCCDSATKMNPHMEFAQMRPGSKLGSWEGSPNGIIETVDLIKVVEAARILEPSRAWSRAVDKKVKKWFSDYMRWLQTSELGRKEAAAFNNHGTWYDAQMAVFALYIGKINLARGIVGSTSPRRLLAQVERNGAMPHELNRTRSRHYTFFNLQAFFVIAAVAERTGIDLWNWTDTSGVSIRKAFDFAAPYIAKDEPWPFGDIGKYDPFLFTPLFHRAAMVYKERRYTDLLKALPEGKYARDRAQLFY